MIAIPLSLLLFSGLLYLCFILTDKAIDGGEFAVAMEFIGVFCVTVTLVCLFTGLVTLLFELFPI